MFHTILAAVDASPRAEGVVNAAADLGARYGAQVVLLRVIAIPQEFPAAAVSPPDLLSEALEKGAAADLQRLAAGRTNVRAEPPLVYAGQPWRAILDKATQLDADLVVIGSHGYGGWDRILGTTAGKVASHADRSVLVVHDRIAGD